MPDSPNQGPPSDAAPTTLIRDARVAIAWDADSAAHVYRRDVDVAFSPAGIAFVGTAYPGPEPERTVDGRGFLVMPGLVDIHSHPSEEPMNKGHVGRCRQPETLQHLALRVPDGAGARPRGHAGGLPGRARRTPAVGRDHPRRSLGAERGLARSPGRFGAAGLRGADVPLGPLVHPQRTSGRVPVRRGRPGGGPSSGRSPTSTGRWRIRAAGCAP